MSTTTGRKKHLHRRKSRHGTGVVYLLTIVVLFGSGFILGRCTASQQPASDHDVVCYGGAAHREEGKTDSGEPLPWNLRLVNAAHPLEESEMPELTQLKNGQAVDARIYEELQQMMDDARQAGVQPVICSSYRSRQRQEQLFEDKKRRLEESGCAPDQLDERAAEWVARPGSSEHELGLALDMVDLSYQHLDEGQENTPTQRWLMEHSWEYGFVLRYPTDRADLTGVEYEPWHYRYVGREAAEIMHREQLCLEEYLASYYHIK